MFLLNVAFEGLMKAILEIVPTSHLAVKAVLIFL